ncbi:MAG TPA: pyridoxal-dependent decarboxylase [Candidatus Saccharimonadales bacterium]|nr:pyridoxal-dependent decarboxylase [Candidatus Saccharimonadales bacterium]
MNDYLSAILGEENLEEASQEFHDAVDIGLSFKMQQNVRNGDMQDLTAEFLVDELPQEGSDLKDVTKEFEKRFLPYCYNFASPRFMGFPDAGNSIAAITGSILSDFMQQNLINQSFCSPSGTFAEISVIRWLREIVGYKNGAKVNDIFDVGGVITPGGTSSNTIGILLARENHRANTMKEGVVLNDDHYVVVPKGIGHYSVKSAQMWIGCGNRLIEVETKDFRYDLDDLASKLRQYRGKIMAVVAYAGDSRTMTVDHLEAVAKIVKSIDPRIWLHADACHGFSLGFSEKLKYKLKGIEQFDSITTDPHKVMNTPYTISALLVKDPKKMRTVSSLSDLIMQEQYAFGQITPFVGSKPWSSLKIWFAMKNLGKKGFGEIIDKRHALANTLHAMVEERDDFVPINEVGINAVVFMYTGGQTDLTLDELNELNKQIHSQLIAEGIYHLHQFSVPDPGVFARGEIIYPLRFMSGNPLTTSKHLQDMLTYVAGLGTSIRQKKH